MQERLPERRRRTLRHPFRGELLPSPRRTEALPAPTAPLALPAPNAASALQRWAEEVPTGVFGVEDDPVSEKERTQREAFGRVIAGFVTTGERPYDRAQALTDYLENELIESQMRVAENEIRESSSNFFPQNRLLDLTSRQARLNNRILGNELFPTYTEAREELQTGDVLTELCGIVLSLEDGPNNQEFMSMDAVALVKEQERRREKYIQEATSLGLELLRAGSSRMQ